MKCQDSEILFGDQAIQSLVASIAQVNSSGSKIFVLLDENTHEHCWPLIENHFMESEVNLMVIEPGEKSKSLEIAAHLWNAMLEQNADRQSILINVGGGVVTDLGGFIASTFKRGIQFINMPTSLLGAVDAAIGGKTGIDLGTSKNQVGTFAWPSQVLVIAEFLKTLSEADKLSGLAECFKHGLLHSKALFEEIQTSDSMDQNLIQRIIEVKVKTVESDPKESGIRKSLNLGHTIGHAIESSCLADGNPIPHGHAVAMGIHAELKISEQVLNLNTAVLEKWEEVMNQFYPKCKNWKSDISELQVHMKSDKKNVAGQLRFSLLADYGVCQIDQPVSEEQLNSGIEHLNSWLAK